MERSSIAKDGALSDEEAAELRVRLKKLGAIDREDIDVSGFGNILGETTCVLGADILVRVPEEVGDVVSSCCKR